ncbi:MAG: metallophosphoesterase family protein [Myxococcales bacterium]|nr:metallophosphoesterase family protein [Myxococcales bacterium]
MRFAESTLSLRDDGGLRVAIVSDTHSALDARALPLLKALHPDAILHAGDIGDLAVLATLAELAPVTAVRGNIDERAPDLPDVVTIDVRSKGETVMRALLTHIAVAGAKLRADAARLAHAHEAGLVLCGHSHVPFLGRDRGLLVFNPGSAGPRRFHLPIVFGVLEIADGRMSLRHVDCETGQPWLP